jgi:tetratricopeptide (TPR) repeat protein
MRSWLIAACASFALLTPALHADNDVNHLMDLAKQAHARGALDQEADALCQAATLDPRKYSKKCERARADVARQLDEFKALLGTGQFEMQKKDYQGAIRDLSKIRFGPLAQQAQALVAQAKSALAQPSVDATGAAALNLAQAAYQQGDFNTAAAQASQVHSPNLQANAQQILTNIKVYQDTMSAGDALAKNGDYKGAEEKYTFASKINANGPGNPADKLSQMDALLQKQTAGQQPAQEPAAKPAQSKVNYAAMVKSDLAQASDAEARGDLKGALQAFDKALALDGLQPEALAGKQRVIAELRKNQKDLEQSLGDGVLSYYASDFAHADEALNLYLSGSDTRRQGVAHFYLGASLLSQAILADPQGEGQASDLRQKAQQQFQLARQAHYKPVEKLISPKILEEWAKSESQP